MDKKLLWTLSIEGIIGVVATLGLYLWESTVSPCQGCWFDISHIYHIFMIGITVFVLLITYLIAGIGKIIRKDTEQKTKTNRTMDIIVLLVVIAIFTFIYYSFIK